MTAKLIYSSSVPGVGRVRVTYSAEWSEYIARLYKSPGRVSPWEVGPAPGEELAGEYFTDDRADAIGTAQLMLADLADRGA